MLPYIICFLLTICLAVFAEYLDEKNSKWYYAIAFLVVLTPAILAGCRDYNIGTDVLVYAKNYHEQAIKNGFDMSVVEMDSKGLDSKGFFYLAVISSFFSDSLNVFLFAISFVINTCIYVSLHNMRQYSSIWLGEAIFLLCCYNETFNMMKQDLAMAIIILSASYVINHQYIKGLFLVGVAYIFHSSAIIGLFIISIVYIANRIDDIKNSESKKLLQGIFLCSSMILFFIIDIYFYEISMYVFSLGIVRDTLYSYMDNAYIVGNLDYGVIFYMAAYAVLLIIYKRMTLPTAFLVIAAGDIVLYYLRMEMYWLYRVSTWFFWFKILSLSQIKISLSRIWLKKQISINDICVLFVITISACYWYLYVVRRHNHETVPYISQILGI